MGKQLSIERMTQIPSEFRFDYGDRLNITCSLKIFDRDIGVAIADYADNRCYLMSRSIRHPHFCQFV